MSPPPRRPGWRNAPAGVLAGALALVIFGAATTSCSLRKFAANSVGNALATGPDVFSSDDDADLVAGAVPFGLKTMESLLATVPNNRNLLLAACRGFTQYAYAFVQIPADDLEATDYARATAQRERARRLFLRARDYGLRELELGNRGVTRALSLNPDAAVARFRVKDVPGLYWTAAAWGSAISLGKDHPELVADLPAVRAMIERAVRLDEGFEGGALHEALIVLEALPPALGGSPDRARQHFRRAVELSHGSHASTYLIMAQSISVMTQNRREFRELLESALAIDPARDSTSRLENVIVQQQARRLLAREDEFFLDDGSPDTLPHEESH
jgi:predicted anti-sigma-YlaC factor YlaD